jgi:hypothetical protein
MAKVGQLRRWMSRIPALPRESEPGTHFLLIESYEANSGLGNASRALCWDAMHDGVVKWYYDSEVEQHSEVING